MRVLIIIPIVILVTFGSCKKEKAPARYASINLVNASIGAGSIRVNYHGKPVNWASYAGANGNVAFASSQLLTVFNLNNDYQIQAVPVLDTLKSVINVKLPIEADGMYSLYTIGQADNFDYLFNKEDAIPYNLTDSAVSIRFINLSPNSPVVNVNLAQTPGVFEAAGLRYKQQTNFKNYPLKKIIPLGSITWEVRDAANNSLLTSYTLPTTAISPYNSISVSLSRFKSITLAIKGLAGTTTGTNAYSIFPVPNY